MPETTGLTRRDLLKRGGLIGAVAWATPVVQVVGMRPASAQFTSPTPCKVYCIKWEPDGTTTGLIATCDDQEFPILAGSWQSLGGGEGNCLGCPDGGIDQPPGDDVDFVVYGDLGSQIWVSFPSKYQLGPPVLPDPRCSDLSAPTAGSAKCASNAATPVFPPEPEMTASGDPLCVYPDGYEVQDRVRVSFTACPKPNGGLFDISHIELIVQDCS